jgi:GNAT superfamily N-acetyltransferase
VTTPPRCALPDCSRPAGSWIAGLMRENYDAVGFIPEPTVERQYITQGRYVLQHDEAGRRVGYLLHSEPTYGRPLTIAQHCIEFDRQRHGYGEQALRELIERAESVHASCITARVGTDLEALHFWLAEGFQVREIVPGGQKRQRSIARLWLPLSLPLIEEQP